MKTHRLASCENCWFNGLQNGAIGLSLGYCVEHRVVLKESRATTCGKHFRKDLVLPSVEQFKTSHQRVYPIMEAVVELATGEVANETYVSQDSRILKTDIAGSTIVDYGVDDTKISSLSALKRSPDIRLEFALLNLSRSYTYRCTHRQGPWTSGLNILWWVKNRLATIPNLGASDIRYSTTSSLDRQADIAMWSLIMARLLFISDVGYSAGSIDPETYTLRDIAEEAALETGKISTKKLIDWVKKRGLQKIDAALPVERYRSLIAPLIEHNGDY